MQHTLAEQESTQQGTWTIGMQRNFNLCSLQHAREGPLEASYTYSNLLQ